MKLTPKKISELKQKGFTGLCPSSGWGDGCSFDAPCGKTDVLCKPGYLGKDGLVWANKQVADIPPYQPIITKHITKEQK